MKKEKKKLEFTSQESQLIFECSVCKKLYPKSGICQTCDVVLKKKGG